MDVLFTTPPLPSHPPSIDLFVACPPPGQASFACLSTRTSQNTIPRLRVSKLMAYEDGERHADHLLPNIPLHREYPTPALSTSTQAVNPLPSRPSMCDNSSDEEYQVGNGMGGEMGRMKKKPVELAFKSNPPTMDTCLILLARFDIGGDFSHLELYYEAWLCLNFYWQEDGMDVDVGMGSSGVRIDDEDCAALRSSAGAIGFPSPLSLLNIDLILTSRTTYATWLQLRLGYRRLAVLGS
ncbi:hypothetical protein ONZ45_g15307 [Pleurotus djamor]|nr:hypothetical protein ONZ45_g15307 [Pleurotus djamor]